MSRVHGSPGYAPARRCYLAAHSSDVGSAPTTGSGGRGGKGTGGSRTVSSDAGAAGQDSSMIGSMRLDR